MSKGVTDFSFLDVSNDTMAGFESIDSEVMAVPFLRILQKTSSACDPGAADYIKGAQAGSFINTVTQEVLGEAVNVIILRFDRTYVEWKPSGGGFVARHTPSEARKVAVDAYAFPMVTHEGNDLTETYEYHVLLEGREKEGPMLFSLSSSNIKKARELNRMMTSHVMPDGNRAKPYYLVYEVRTERKENDFGSWYGAGFAFTHYINEKQYAVIKQARESLPAISDNTVIDLKLPGGKPSGEMKDFDNVPY